jgi:predicted DsbA family dithiol-disulfide isomerase
MVARLGQVAAQLGLPFGTRTMTYNSRLAQELGKWVEEKGKGDAYHDAVFRAYFAHGKNIASRDVLTDIIASLALDTQEARGVLDVGDYRQAVDDDWAESHRMRVTAVPTFMINGHALVGAQPYNALEQFLLDHHRGIVKQ